MEPRHKDLPLHVDLIQNDWMGGWQVRLARVEAVDDHVELRIALPKYEDLLQRADPEVHLEKAPPQQAFEILSRMYHNSYFFVTEPHDDAHCLYLNGVVQMDVRLAPAQGAG
jgi:hypothetical protein